MKRFGKLIILGLLISIVTIGCTDITSDDSKKDPVKDQAIEDEEKDEDVTEETMEEFLQMIEVENRASDLGVYIKGNIEDVTEKDGDEMVHWLTIYQTEIMNEFNSKVTSPEYLEALDENMNGILDGGEIDSIENEEIRNDYQELIDGYMTIVRYEEVPVVETDWEAFNEISPYISKDLVELIQLYSKKQNYEYDLHDLDVDSIVNDMIKTETIFKDHDSKFIDSLANKLYASQLNLLLVGPEGSHLSFFVDKDSDEYNDIMELKREHLDSYFGKVIEELDSHEYEEIIDVSNELDKYLKFGIESKNSLKTKKFTKDNKEYNIFEIKMPDDEDKAERINNIIKADLNEYVEEDTNQKATFEASIYPSYEDHEYISYNGMVYIEDENEGPKEINIYKVFDYIEEEHIALEEYLEIEFSELKDYLKEAKDIEILSTPEFQITNNGIDIFLEDVQDSDEYVQLSKKDLIPYLSLDRLTKQYQQE